jgi:hypothetical protein
MVGVRDLNRAAMRAILVPLAIVQMVLFCTLAAGGGELPAEDKATGCRFEPPEDWNQLVVRWAGSCTDGIANGEGVLRAYRDGKVVQTFYGRMASGHLALGAIETESGFIAGRFSKGRRLESDDPQVFIDAFRAAGRAAEQASASFRRQGNAASAKFYADKAKLLRDQMGD